jgi:hypothetical protein
MFSLVVPTFNRNRPPAATLDGLPVRRADVAHEIIVVDNNSTDGTGIRLVPPNYELGCMSAKPRGWGIRLMCLVAYSVRDFVLLAPKPLGRRRVD